MGIFEDGRDEIMGNEDEMLKDTEEVTVTLEEVLQVFEHGAGDDGESHRFYSREKEASGDYKVSKMIIFHEYTSGNIFSGQLKKKRYQTVFKKRKNPTEILAILPSASLRSNSILTLNVLIILRGSMRSFAGSEP